MRQDAFTGGVDPGGLWNQNDIRILLCYILHSVGSPLSGEELSQILQRKALANYFEAQDALAALEARGNVDRGVLARSQKHREPHKNGEEHRQRHQGARASSPVFPFHTPHSPRSSRIDWAISLSPVREASSSLYTRSGAW